MTVDTLTASEFIPYGTDDTNIEITSSTTCEIGVLEVLDSATFNTLTATELTSGTATVNVNTIKFGTASSDETAPYIKYTTSGIEFWA